MRRWHLITALVMTLILTACGGNTASTPVDNAPPERQVATVVQGEFNPAPFATDVPEEFVDSPDDAVVAQTLEALGAPIFPTDSGTALPFGGIEVLPEDLPPAGEIGYEATDDPDIDLIFDQVRLVRVGGPNNTTLDIQLFQDGSLYRNGEIVSNVGPNAVIALDNVLDEMNIFGIRGFFAASITDPRDFEYNLTIERAGASMTIQADDSMMPIELAQLFGQIIALVDVPPEAFRSQ